MGDANSTIDTLARRELQPQETAVARQEFGATELRTASLSETSATALAERERATISALFIMAERHPRSIPAFERGLLLECQRPGFAEGARYKLKRRVKDPDTGRWGEKEISGWSIRFAEAAMRHWRNVFPDSKITYEDDDKRIIRFLIIDLESNVALGSELQLNKIVERHGYFDKGQLKPPSGREVLGTRQNSEGDTIFIVKATDDELQMKSAAAWSKFIRNVLRFMPSDILEAAEDQVIKTLQGIGPEAAMKRIQIAFDKLGVTLGDLQLYLGHALSEVTAQEIDELRGVHTAMKEGETWARIMEEKNPPGSRQEQLKVQEEKLAKLREEAAAKDKADAPAPKADEDVDRAATPGSEPAAAVGASGVEQKQTAEATTTKQSLPTPDAPPRPRLVFGRKP